METAWNTNKNTNGEWIRLGIRDGKRYEVAGFSVANGYWKNNKVYYENARARTVNVYCDGNFVQTFHFEDRREYQVFLFDSPVVCSSVMFEIVDGYAGSTYNDCCITEIELFDLD